MIVLFNWMSFRFKMLIVRGVDSLGIQSPSENGNGR